MNYLKNKIVLFMIEYLESLGYEVRDANDKFIDTLDDLRLIDESLYCRHYFDNSDYRYQDNIY